MAPTRGDAPDLSDLARRAAAGDRAAFDAVHARLNPGLRQMLVRRGANLPTAEELAQAAWAGVWKACVQGRYDPSRASIATFAYAVAGKVWLQHLRARGRPDDASAVVDRVDPSADPSEAARLAEVLEVLRGVLEGREEALTAQERWVVRHAAEGASDREIAARLGMAPSTANAAKQGAYAKLRRLLGRLGFGDDSGERGVGTGE